MKYVVHHEGGYYYVWHGADEQFDDKPVATVSTSSRKKVTGNAKKRSSSKANIDAQNDSDEDVTPARSLRTRTDRQKHPFQMDKMEHNHFRKGSKVTESFLEKELRAFEKKLPFGEMAKKRRSASSHSETSSPSPSLSTSSITDEPDISATVVRTWFKEFDAYIPVAMKTDSVDELLDTIEQAWQFQLGDRIVRHCIVTFPWSTGNSKLTIMRNNKQSTALEILLKEIRQAPTWTQGNCAIDVEIFS